MYAYIKINYIIILLNKYLYMLYIHTYIHVYAKKLHIRAAVCHVLQTMYMYMYVVPHTGAVLSLDVYKVSLILILKTFVDLMLHCVRCVLLTDD